jgi:hypothetical protein
MKGKRFFRGTRKTAGETPALPEDGVHGDPEAINLDTKQLLKIDPV